MNRYRCWNCRKIFFSEYGLFCPHCCYFYTNTQTHTREDEVKKMSAFLADHKCTCSLCWENIYPSDQMVMVYQEYNAGPKPDRFRVPAHPECVSLFNSFPENDPIEVVSPEEMEESYREMKQLMG